MCRAGRRLGLARPVLQQALGLGEPLTRPSCSALAAASAGGRLRLVGTAAQPAPAAVGGVLE
eukprot:13263357-Alexandrium_andersonii.AAC.1